MSNPMRDAILRYAESRLSYLDPVDGSRWDEFWQSLIQSLEYDEQCERHPSVLRYFLQRLVINPLRPRFGIWREGAILWLGILTTCPEFRTDRYVDSPPHAYSLILGGRFGRWLKFEFDNITPKSSGERDHDGREVSFHIVAGGTHLGTSQCDRRRFSNGVQLVSWSWVIRQPTEPFYRKEAGPSQAWSRLRTWRRKVRTK